MPNFIVYISTEGDETADEVQQELENACREEFIEYEIVAVHDKSASTVPVVTNQLVELLDLLAEDVFTDAPEYADRVARINELADLLRTI